MMRVITQFHEREQLISAGQTVTGRTAIWIAGIVLLVWHDINVLMLASFTLVLLFPDRRHQLLMLAAVGMVVGKFLPRRITELSDLSMLPDVVDPSQWLRFILQVTAALLFIVTVVSVAIRFDQLPRVIKKFPLLMLHVLIWIALALSSLPHLRMLTLASFMAWRLSYLIASASRGKTRRTSIRDHLIYLVPVFGGTNTPYGKGLEYLRRHEATDRESQTRSQLAGIKLLVVAIIWTVALNLTETIAFARADSFFKPWLAEWTLGMPQMVEIMHSESPPSISLAWLSIYLELIRATLILAISGHIIVGCLRLLGFNVFRNTYKPLLAESIVEFWNRFYFYFKELLVDFFFYPTFLRCAWAAPKLRLFFAVFAAAFAGNVYYHILTKPNLVTQMELGLLWVEWGPRLVYCFFLALGIWLSMLRQQMKRESAGRPNMLLRLRAIAGVWTFYALIHIWNVKPREMGFAMRFDFLASLIGL